MKTSEITTAYICNFLHEDINEMSENDLAMLGNLLDAAVAYVCSYTGMSDDELDGEEDYKKIDYHEDVTIAVLMLISDMYDNRAIAVDKSNINRTAEIILNMHCFNFL